MSKAARYESKGEEMSPLRIFLFLIWFAYPVIAQESDARRESNFDRVDLDKDGRISREEFTGRLENFRRRDLDGDGFVTREEFGLEPKVTQGGKTTKAEQLTAGDNEKTPPQGPQISRIPLSLSPISEIRAISEDGSAAQASYRVPPGKGPFPAIVFQHGGLGHQDEQGRHAQLTEGTVQTRFLSMGYVTVQATRRDYTDNPQAEGPILDFLAIVEAVRELEEVDSEGIVVMGGSGGASMTLDLISRTTVSAAVAGEPASVIFAGMLTRPAQDREVRYHPINDPEAFWTPDVVAKVRGKVGRFQTPLLILHGDIHPLKTVNMDYVIPEIRKAGKTLEVKVYPGKEHGFYWGRGVDSKFIEQMILDIRTFAERYLETKPQEVRLQNLNQAARAATYVQAQRSAKLQPAHTNIRYGDHERNVLDLYLAESDARTPLVLYIHGGGFRGGDKGSLDPADGKALLEAGFSIAAINYRLTNTAPAPAAYLDCARALQFLRYNAERWNLDPSLVASTGGSAGAGTSLWLAFHDDLADPKSEDPIARQSTRLTCIAVKNGQSSYDPRFAEKIGIPRPNFERHQFFLPFYDITESEIDTPKSYARYEEAAAITYLTKDDPPALLWYTYANEDVTEESPLGLIVHHPKFGTALKERMDRLGIECIVQYRGSAPSETIRHGELKEPTSPVKFIQRQFKRVLATRKR
jgi:acetyl esterase/lipase